MSETIVIYASLALTWCLLLGLAISVLRIQRELGKVLRAVEGRAAEGPPIGSPSPSLEGETMVLNGRGRIIDGGTRLETSPVPTVVWFMAAGCQPCLASRTAIGQLAAEYRGKANMIVNCVGNSAAVSYFAEELRGPVTVVADPERINAREWRVFISPFAVITDASGVVRRKVATVSAEQVGLALDAVMGSGGVPAADTAPAI